MELVLSISDTEGIGDKHCTLSTFVKKNIDNLQHTVFAGM